jgi:hypothetical protein
MQLMTNHLRAGLIAGLGIFMMTASAAAQAALAVSIGEGSSVIGQTETHSFPTNTAVVSGGSGSYTYMWSPSITGLGHWSSGSGQTFAPFVTIYTNCEDSTAQYTVTVTDQATGQKAVSNVATYYYDYYIAGRCP